MLGEKTMAIATEQQVWTDEAFLALPEDEHRYEVVNGKLVDMGNSGMEHGYIASILTIFLGGFVQAQQFGAICDSSTAFALKSGNKRSPDVSFVDKSRLKGLKRPPRGIFQGSPDLAIEILSPGNTVEEIHTKIVEYFDNQTRLVWVIHPAEQFVLVYHTPSPDRLLQINDCLDGEDVIAGFSMPIVELFREWNF
jgi:Uma2 family endonuclease